MDSKPIDWVSEAKRISRAFGINEELRFSADDWNGVMTLENDSSNQLEINDELYLSVAYHQGGRSFALYDDLGRCESDFLINWANEIEIRFGSTQYWLIISAALFHLGLLTPEIEAALGVTVSAHEKAEWLLASES